MRGRDGFVLTDHEPNPYNILKWWGSDDHRKLLKNIDPNVCMRCAFSRYNECIENTVIQDNIFKNFL
jgi:hypothetical protein